MSEDPPSDSVNPSVREEDDEAVVRRIQAYLGELRQNRRSHRSANNEWNRFFEFCARLFLRLTRDRARSEDDRDDSIQDLWLMLVTRLPELRYDPRRGQLRDWIVAAAHHRLADQATSRRYQMVEHLGPGAAERLASREPDPAAAFERKALRELVGDALAELQAQVAPRDYQAFVLHWIDGWSVREIAHCLGMSAGQIWSSQHRTSAKLRPLLLRRLGTEHSTKPGSGTKGTS